MVIDIVGKEQFDEHIAKFEEEGKLVLVDFWAERCGPCRMLGPVLHDIAEKQEDIIVLKIDVDEESNQDLSMQYGVRSIPQVNLFKAGESVDQFVGAIPPDQIEAFVSKHQ